MLTTGPDNPNTNNMIGGVGMYAAPQYTNTYVKQKEKPVYGKAELVLSVLMFLFSFIFVRFVVYNVTGIISSLLYIAFFAVTVIYLKKKGFAFSGFNKLLGALLFIFSTVFTITDNSFIKFLTCVFLFAAGAYFIYSVCADRKDVERYLPYAMKKSLFEYPFSKFSAQADILSDKAKDSETSSNIKRVIIGLVLTIPVTVIVAALLMKADDGVNYMISDIFDTFYSDEIWTVIMQLAFALPLSLYGFGLIYRCAFRKDIRELTDEECADKVWRKRIVSNLIFYTAAAPVLLLYVLFFVSQASYFLSAFMGKLPEGFSYAEYARKGFFELCWIVVINLGIMIIMNLHSKNSGEEKTVMLKIYNMIFCIFTLILIATAVSKMVMYIDAYGLTVMRVYTTWFMILCAYIFLLTIIKQFRPDMHLAKHITIGFTLMFAFLCFSRPESLIVKYNHMMGKVTADELADSGIYEMSDDGLLAAVNEGLMQSDEARERSSKKHSDHYTDDLNISTLLLENK